MKTAEKEWPISETARVLARTAKVLTEEDFEDQRKSLSGDDPMASTSPDEATLITPEKARLNAQLHLVAQAAVNLRQGALVLDREREEIGAELEQLKVPELQLVETDANKENDQ